MRDIDLLSLNKGTVDTLIEKYGISAGDADYIAGRDKRALQFFVLIMFILSIITAPFLRLAAIGGRAGTLNAAIFYLAVIFFIGDFARFKIRARRAFRREVWLLKTLLEHEDVRQFYKDDGASDSQRYFTESNLMNWRWDFDFVSHMRREIVSSLVKRFDIHYKKIVDLGCGDCGCLKLLESERNICCGIDLNWALLEKNAIKDKSPYLCAADITNVPFRQVSFDVVFCLEALEHILSPATLLEEMGRILKPGGVFIMTTPNRNSIQANCFLNPIRLAAQILALRFDGLLDPKPLVTIWRRQYYFHTAFSIKELESLLKRKDMKIRMWASYGIGGGVAGALLKMRPSIRKALHGLNRMERDGYTGEGYLRLRETLLMLEERYGRRLGRLNVFFQKIPWVRRMGTNHLIIMEKVE